MLITVKNTCSNYGLNVSVLSLIIYIDPWCITTSSLHVDAEVIYYKVGNMCWDLQGAILVDYLTFASMFSII